MMERTRLDLSSINSIFALAVPRVPHRRKFIVYRFTLRPIYGPFI